MLTVLGKKMERPLNYVRYLIRNVAFPRNYLLLRAKSRRRWMLVIPWKGGEY